MSDDESVGQAVTNSSASVRARWKPFRSLRSRLLFIAVSLLAIGIVVTDITAVTALRSYLTDQLDRQLVQARDPLTRRVGPVSNDRGVIAPPPSAQGPGRRGIGLSDFYIEIRRGDGSVETQVPSALRDERDPRPAIDADVVAMRVDGEPFTLRAQGDQTFRYRAIVARASDGSGTVTIAAPLDTVDSTVDRLVLIEVMASIGVLLILVALGWVVIRSDLQPLETMAETAGSITTGDLSLRVQPADGQSEVGKLGLAINTMLDEIEASFAERHRTEERLRRFAADASHELRTPLTAVRGYAELYRQGAIGNEQRLDEVMGRIESEAKRMGMVVEDLMLLARLDQGRPLARDPVNIKQVTENATADARAIDTRRRIDLRVPTESVVVTGDESRLHQVIMNLLSNALKHTPTESAVHVELRQDDEFAVVDVVDEGPGLSSDAAEKVFERFYRVDVGRSREQGGAGLGLSIVQALTKAHGGDVTVHSTPGEGARFTVRIPLESSSEGDNEVHS